MRCVWRVDRVSERRKQFKRFSTDESGGERLIGGSQRGVAFLPRGLVRPAHLLVAGDDPAAFCAAVADRDVVIDIGAGKGRFAVERAALSPDKVVLATETRLGFCLTALRRAERALVQNLWAAWGDARRTVPAFVRPGAACEVTLLFPDPWWKRRHAGRRHGSLMVRVIADALRAGGMLVLKTDVPEYLEALVETVSDSHEFEEAPVPDDMPLTDREARLREMGTKVFAAAFRRR